MSDVIPVEAIATDRLLKARAELTVTRRFYAVLIANVEPVLTRSVPTMATDGVRHYFNPEFIMKQNTKQLLGLQAHESEHDARHHGTRRNGRDPKKWNIACDYAINGDLIAEGFELPEGGYVDSKYFGMSAEDIYRSRELDEQKKEQEEQQQDDQQDDQQQDDQQQDDAGDDASDKDENGDKDSSQDKDGDGGDKDGDTGDKDGDGGGEQEEGDKDGEGDKNGPSNDGSPTDKDGDAGNGEGDKDGDADGDGPSKDGDAAGAQSSGDPGMCGEVLDSAIDAKDIGSEEAKWDRNVRIAASMAKAVGQLPGHVSREIERENNPPRNWRDTLREFCEQGALRIETWNRPNRRFIGSGLTLPSSQRDGINKAAMMIDTSGSVDNVALAHVRNEAQALLDDGVIDELVVIYGDTVVTRVDHYTSSDEIVFDPRGGGGTDMIPLFKYIADEVDDASFIICFTDLYIGEPGPEPHCPVLFAVHGYPNEVKRLMEAAPWGAPCIDVG